MIGVVIRRPMPPGNRGHRFALSPWLSGYYFFLKETEVMRISAYGFLVSSLLASGIPPMASQDILQGGATVVLGLTVWYMLAKTFPTHLRALKDSREAYMKAITDERTAHLEIQEDMRREFLQSMREISFLSKEKS